MTMLGDVISGKASAKKLLDALALGGRSLRSAFFPGMTVILMAAALLSLSAWRNRVEENEQIAALGAGRDIEVRPEASAELLLARIAFLTKREEIDRARGVTDLLDRRSNAALKARGHYLLGNSLLRKGLGLVEQGQLDEAGPFINLAKREYRNTLRLQPDYWDAKFNLDVAARLVRDFPEYERKGGDELSADPKKLWTDIPGAPEGLP
jgi:mxaK protein